MAWTDFGGVGVGRRAILTQIDNFRQGPGHPRVDPVWTRRTPSHPDAAEVRPCHPRPGSPVELDERYRRVQERCLKVLAVHHEVVRQEQLLRRRWR